MLSGLTNERVKAKANKEGITKGLALDLIVEEWATYEVFTKKKDACSEGEVQRLEVELKEISKLTEDIKEKMKRLSL